MNPSQVQPHNHPQRVTAGGQKGSVRFIGQVSGHNGTWVGVEWDDPSRGKHDGTVNGVQYFKCLNGLNSGSFVRWQKVCFGEGLIGSLIRRHEGVMETQYVSSGKNRRKVIEIVGIEKIRTVMMQLDKLAQANLSNLPVAFVEDDVSEVGTILSSMEFLNLSNTLTASWQTIQDISRVCPKLTTIDLSINRINFDSKSSIQISSLKLVILNRCDISRNDISHLAAQLPNLEDLQLCNNEISDLKMLEAFTRLNSLDLSNNQISQWEQVAQLGDHIKGLQRLVLSNNPLSEVRAPQGEQFQLLSCLLLGDCRITSWRCINYFNSFPSLKRLRHSRNPVLETVKGGGRFETIARVAGLTELNNSQVKPLERKDAELRYLAKILDRNVGCQVDQSLLIEHPRLQNLIEKYDYFNTHYVHETHVAPRTLASVLLEVNLSCKVDIRVQLALNENKENKNVITQVLQDYCPRERENISTFQIQNEEQNQHITRHNFQQSTGTICAKIDNCCQPLKSYQNEENDLNISSQIKQKFEDNQLNSLILQNQNGQNMNGKKDKQLLSLNNEQLRNNSNESQRTSHNDMNTMNMNQLQKVLTSISNNSLQKNKSNDEYKHLGSVIRKLPANLSLQRLSLIYQRVFRLDKLRLGCVDTHFVVKRQSDGEMVEIFKENDGSLELQQIGGMDGLEITYVLVDSSVGKLEREYQLQKLGRLAEEQLRRGDRIQALQVAEVQGV